MIIKFKNIGTIKETSLDLRPLTVIIGPNNSNKTYISYSVYGLLKYLNSSVRIGRFGIPFKRTGEKTFIATVDDGFWRSLSNFITLEVRRFRDSLTTFFQDSSTKLFEKTELDLSFTADELEHAVDRMVKNKRLGEFRGIVLVVSRSKGILTITATPTEERSVDAYMEDYIVQYFFMSRLVANLVGMPFLLPAERNAFIITYRMLANRRFRFLRETQREILGSEHIKPRQLELLKEQGDIRYPEPIEDFLDFLAEVEFQKSVRIDSKKETELQKLADRIEASIQNKNKTSLSPTKLGGRELKVKVKPGLTIDLYNASSSIKQLAPLLLYLRYRAAKDDVLVIDEPEMNLHPESQAKLLEILGSLINLGVRVLLTTHSPYFMAHLNNLARADGSVKGNGTAGKNLYLKDSRAFLSWNQISAYEMRDNKLQPLKDSDFGIRWDTLSDVSSDLQQKFFQINKDIAPSDDDKQR